MRRIAIILILVGALMTACHNNDYTPKPQAYIRIDVPQHNYSRLDTLPGSIEGIRTPGVVLPFTFEINEGVEVTLKKRTPSEVWVDLNYPQWDGVVFLTYKHLAGADDLRGQTDTSMHLVEKHYQFASGIDEQAFDSDDNTVHAVTWNIKGPKVASTYQFYATDSVHHFLRGALYLNRAPNNDSLAPVLNYIQEDIDHLIETLRWR